MSLKGKTGGENTIQIQFYTLQGTKELIKIKTVFPWAEDLEPNASWARKGLVAQGLAVVRRCVAFGRRPGPRSPFTPVQSVAPHDGQ